MTRFTRISPPAAAAALLLTLTATLARATDAPELSPICTDRPTKSNAACAVDLGHFQYESDLASYTRLKIDGTTTETWLVPNPTLKYGIAPNVDVEANIAPFEVVRTRNVDGSTSTLRGVGDLFLRVKWNFLPAGDGKLAIAALPYVKVATARRGIGNRATEGGALLPVNYQVTDKLVFTTVPEFDAYKDASGNGRHFNTSQLVNLGYALPNSVTIYGELWGDWNVDPVGTTKQYSADVAAAWAISKTLQVDVGANFGLNRATPGIQAYFGVSQKF